MKYNGWIVILLIIVLIVLWICNDKRENYASTSQSIEAVQNISKVYSDISGTVAFNNTIVTNALTVQGTSNLVPRGTIVMWYGVTPIPDGWGFCDGSVHTATDGVTKIQSPDLRGRFVLCVNPDQPGVVGSSVEGAEAKLGTGSRVDYSLAKNLDQGGETKHTLTVNEMPKHTHDIWNWNGVVGTNPVGINASLGDGTSNYSGNTFVSSVTGGSLSHNNLPPYVALAYIIKL